MTLLKAVRIYNKLPIAKIYKANKYVSYRKGFVIVGKNQLPDVLGCNTFWIRDDGSVIALVPGILLNMVDKPDFSKLKEIQK